MRSGVRRLAELEGRVHEVAGLLHERQARPPAQARSVVGREPAAQQRRLRRDLGLDLEVGVPHRLRRVERQRVRVHVAGEHGRLQRHAAELEAVGRLAGAAELADRRRTGAGVGQRRRLAGNRVRGRGCPRRSGRAPALLAPTVPNSSDHARAVAADRVRHLRRHPERAATGRACVAPEAQRLDGRARTARRLQACPVRRPPGTGSPRGPRGARRPGRARWRSCTLSAVCVCP